MICSKCGSENMVLVGGDIFECNKCGDKISVITYICEDCLTAVRYKDDEMLDTVSLLDTKKTFESVNIKMNSSMSDMVHKCIRCGNNVIADKNTYRCPYCNFSWEMVDE